MSIIIGSARHDENGKYSGGSLGDTLQISTPDFKGEVSMQNMYTHSKGWYIYRFKNINYANANAKAMEKYCNDPNVGYDQGNRAAIMNYNGIGKTECDCSSLARRCIKDACGKDIGNFTTATAPNIFDKSGLFETKINYINQEKTPIYNGDILVTKTKGHVVIVVSGNPRSIASTDSALTNITTTNSTSYTVQITAGALNIRKGPGTNYTITGVIRDRGKYVIIEEQNGWGKLSNNKGWISLKYTKKV